MAIRVIFSMALLAVTACEFTSDQYKDPGTAPWKVATYESCQIDPALLPDLPYPYLIVRDGKICHEHYPGDYARDDVFHAWSVTKTLTATVFGRLSSMSEFVEDDISYNDLVSEYIADGGFPETRICNLLNMTAWNSNLYSWEYDTSGSQGLNKIFEIVDAVVQEKPGVYGAANVTEFVDRRIFEAIGMRDSSLADYYFGGFGMNTTLRDLARMGLLLAHKGAWDGWRRIPLAYVNAMSESSSANQDYGMGVWLDRSSCGAPDVISAVGLGGQIVAIHPSLDVVLVGRDVASGNFVGLWSAVRPAFNDFSESDCAGYRSGTHRPFIVEEDES